MLQRSVTAGPTLLVLTFVVLVTILRTWQASSIRRLTCLALAVGVPLLCGVIWTAYSDLIKSYNFVGQEISLQFRLSDKYVGTLAQRFDTSALKEVFWKRMFEENAASFLGAALIIGSLFSRDKFIRTFVGVCLILTAFPVMLFFDVSLFLHHYQVSSVVFLLASLAFACTVWLPTIARWAGLVPLMTTIIVLANVFTFWSKYGHVVRTAPGPSDFRGLAVGDVINRYTPIDSGILAFGIHNGINSYCPEIAYFSERKAFTVPVYREQVVENDPASYLGGKELGAMAFCSKKNKDRYNRIIERYSQTSEPRLFRVSGCYVWLPNAASVILADGTEVKPIRFIE
jgi:hypothetical protein